MDPLRIIGLGIGAMGASPAVIALSMEAWDRIRPYFIPQHHIDALARDVIATFGPRAPGELVTLASRARLRGETAEEGAVVRVMAAVRRIEGDA